MGATPDSPRGHIIAVTVAAWGHVKAACALLPKIVRYQKVYATLFVAAALYEKASKEIDAQFLPEVDADLRKLIKVVPLESGPTELDAAPLNLSFLKEYRTLISSKRVESNSAASRDEDAWGQPRLVLLDFFLYDSLQGIRAISGTRVPVFAFQSASVAAFLATFGPKELGGLGDLDEELKKINVADKDAAEDEAERIFRRLNGELIRIPGIPPMYDYELIPQKSIFPKDAIHLIAKSHKFMKECDGAVMNTTTLFEGDAIRAFRDWFGTRPVLSPGPFDFSIIERQRIVSPTGAEVEAFLDSALTKYGPHSVVYLSFGSVFWPQEPEKVWAIFDVLIEQGVPFIFAHASRHAIVPDEVTQKIKRSGLGYSSTWLPQTTILSHKACGWFISHCGHNSVTEALSEGVPLICWPFDADQPVNAANVTIVHNLGYELFEVRMGPGLRPIHRLGDRRPEGTIESVKREFTEILKMAKGQDGATKRTNSQAFREKLGKQWAPGGENWNEIKYITDILQI